MNDNLINNKSNENVLDRVDDNHVMTEEFLDTNQESNENNIETLDEIFYGFTPVFSDGIEQVETLETNNSESLPQPDNNNVNISTDKKEDFTKLDVDINNVIENIESSEISNNENNVIEKSHEEIVDETINGNNEIIQEDNVVENKIINEFNSTSESDYDYPENMDTTIDDSNEKTNNQDIEVVSDVITSENNNLLQTDENNIITSTDKTEDFTNLNIDINNAIENVDSVESTHDDNKVINESNEDVINEPINNSDEIIQESNEITSEINANSESNHDYIETTDGSNIKSNEEMKDENTEIASDVLNKINDNNLLNSENKDEEVVATEIDNNKVEENKIMDTEEIEVNEPKNIEQKNDYVAGTTLLEKYGDNLSTKEYVTNPAIGRDNEIKQLILILLTPEKSGILVGKPGIGKTAIVEGLGYQIQRGNVPDALKDYQIHKLNTSSLLGVMPGTSEPKIQVLLNEIKGKQKLILFIDEIHTLIGAGAEGDDSLDFANIFKPGLDRGTIKIIGATTTDEYDRYILTDKAFVRRFQKIEVLEPTKEHTVKILMGSLPKLEHKTGAKLKYTPFIQEKIMTFIVDLTTEYRRVYELSARYPDVALTILQQAFSYAVFDNKKEVGIRDIRKAIVNTKLVYPDVIKKELVNFNKIFKDIYLMETPQRLKGETSI